MIKKFTLTILISIASLGMYAYELVVDHAAAGFIETEITIALNMAGKTVNDITSLKITGGAEMTSVDCIAVRNIFGASLETLDLSMTRFPDNKIPSGATPDEAAFYNMVITTVKLPENVVEIGDRAFHSCENLQTINLPEGLTTIGTYTFHKNYVLEIDELPSTIVTLRNYAFESAYLVKFSIIPESIGFIGTGVFRHCRSITIDRLPDHITTLGGETFRGCISMEQMIFPANFTSMGNRVFQGNTALTKLFFKGFMPPTVGEDPFGNIDASQISVYVPFGSATAYSVTSPWNSMKEIIEYDPIYASVDFVKENPVFVYPNPTTGRFTIKSTKNIDKVQIINLSGEVLEEMSANNEMVFDISHLQKGIYFIRANNMVTKISKK